MICTYIGTHTECVCTCYHMLSYVTLPSLHCIEGYDGALPCSLCMLNKQSVYVHVHGIGVRTYLYVCMYVYAVRTHVTLPGLNGEAAVG